MRQDRDLTEAAVRRLARLQSAEPDIRAPLFKRNGTSAVNGLKLSVSVAGTVARG